MGFWRTLRPVDHPARFKRTPHKSSRAARFKARRRPQLERVEDRHLLAGPQLVAIFPNVGDLLTNGQVRQIAPRELTFRFNDGQVIDSATVVGIQMNRAGGDGSLGTGDDVPINFGFIGIGENPNEVIVRFAETLPDDLFRITIASSGPRTLRNDLGEAFNMGQPFAPINFELDLGAQIVAVVPQPMSRNGSGQLVQAKNRIDVYFNNDDLNTLSAQNPRFYEVIFTRDTATTADDVIINPSLVTYLPAQDKSELMFSADLNTLAPANPGALRLRIANYDDTVPHHNPPLLVASTGDNNARFSNAQNIGTLSAQSRIVSAAIDPQPFPLQLPGSNFEPGHRDIPPQTHLDRMQVPADQTDGITTIAYNFRPDYGLDPTNTQLLNVITPAQKQRAREIFELIGYYSGLHFVETVDQGLVVATGDLRAIDTSVPTGAGGLFGLSGLDRVNGRPTAIMDNAEVWTDEFGGTWFQTAMHEILHLLGLGHDYELPALTIMAGAQDGSFPTSGEPVLPGDHDIVHLRHLYRPDSKDIDIYKFSLADAGVFSAEVIAERRATYSSLDSALTLYREGTGGAFEIVAQNDDYFSEDSFISLDLSAGNYYLAVTSTGNTDFDPRIDDSGFGGTTQGPYDLRFNFSRGPANLMIDATGVAVDGDADGLPGGSYDFWFKIGNTIYVDKSASALGANGGILNPYTRISDAFAAATPGTIVRIVGNGTVDADPQTVDTAKPYEVGFNIFDTPLADGSTMEVPRGVTVMIDAGAVFKLRHANIDVGSNAQGIDRSLGALQVLGTPSQRVFFSSFNDETIGLDTNPLLTTGLEGDWGGIVFRTNQDRAEGRPVLEDQGIFLNYVNHGYLTFGGGSVVVNSVRSVFTPIHMVRARPTVSFNTIVSSADAAMSADPNSFEESFFNGNVAGNLFTADYQRVGPEVHGNRLVNVVVRAGGQINTATNSMPIAIATATPHGLVTGRRVRIAGVQGNTAANGDFTITVTGPSGFTLDLSQGNGTYVASAGDTWSLLQTVDNTLNGLFVRIQTAPGQPLATLDLAARFDDIDIPHLLSETLTITGTVGGSQGTVATQLARFDARLAVDPDVIVKLDGARIETGISSQFIAEGGPRNRPIFTSQRDDRYGGSGTFDSNSDDILGLGEAVPVPGDWGGFYFGPASSASLDNVLITFGGGDTTIEGGFSPFNAIEIRQADVRVANSIIERNAEGLASGNRNGRGQNTESTIFIRGAQPIIVNNIIRDNLGAALSANANSFSSPPVNDYGRSRGPDNAFTQWDDNYGPLVRGNRIGNDAINGMVVRGGVLTTETIWDDTDIVHVVNDEISILNHHTYSGLRLQSSPTESLVVKLLGDSAGFTANGVPLDIDDRLGGTLQILGAPGHPVVLTALTDDTVGAGLDPDGNSQTDTDNMPPGQSTICGLPIGGEVANGTLIDNDVSVNTVGHFEVQPLDAGDVTFGGSSGVTAQGLTQLFTNANWIFEYLNYIDVDGNGGAVKLSGTTVTSAPTLVAPDVVRSSGTFTGANGSVSWTVESKFGNGCAFLENTITLSSAQPIGNLRFINYLDEDVQGVSDDIMFVFGQPGAPNFQVFTLDGPERVGFSQGGIYTAGPGLINARYDGWAADQFAELRSAITGGGTTYSPAGNIDLTDLPAMPDPDLGTIYGPNDVTTAFAWSIDPTANDAKVTTFLTLVPQNPEVAGGEWRSVKFEKYSNDRNVAVVNEAERPFIGDEDVNADPTTAQLLGDLAPHEKAGDDNLRLGFEVHGYIALDDPTDVDVFSFKANAGVEVWVDIDRTAHALDTVVDLIDANGNLVARSNNSHAEGSASNPNTVGPNPVLAGLLAGNQARIMQRDVLLTGVYQEGAARDFNTTNPRDAGFRIVLPGAVGENNTYYIRVRSAGANLNNLNGGLSRGAYQLQLRLRELDELPGSTVRFADVRFATNGIELLGLPTHSPLLGETAEVPGANDSAAQAQNIGNLLNSDRSTLAASGLLATATDVDWFQFSVDYDLIQEIQNYNAADKSWTALFDIDYADGISRPDTVISVFDASGRLVLVGRDSNIRDDQPGPTEGADVDDLSRGTFGSLDPFIGSAQLPAGASRNYFVAISSNLVLPDVLNATFVAGATNSLTRLEPISSMNRIVEDHVGFTGYTTGDRVNFNDTQQIHPYAAGPLLDLSTSLALSTHVRPFKLEDVALYTSTGSQLFTINPATGATAVTVGNLQAGFPMGDISIRTDGRMFGYRDEPGAEVGERVELNPGTGAVIDPDIDGDGADDDAISVNELGGTQVDSMAWARTGVGTYDLYYNARNSGTNQSFLYIADPFDGDTALPFGLIGPNITKPIIIAKDATDFDDPFWEGNGGPDRTQRLYPSGSGDIHDGMVFTINDGINPSTTFEWQSGMEIRTVPGDLIPDGSLIRLRRPTSSASAAFDILFEFDQDNDIRVFGAAVIPYGGGEDAEAIASIIAAAFNNPIDILGMPVWPVDLLIDPLAQRDRVTVINTFNDLGPEIAMLDAFPPPPPPYVEPGAIGQNPLIVFGTADFQPGHIPVKFFIDDIDFDISIRMRDAINGVGAPLNATAVAGLQYVLVDGTAMMHVDEPMHIIGTGPGGPMSGMAFLDNPPADAPLLGGRTLYGVSQAGGFYRIPEFAEFEPELEDLYDQVVAVKPQYVDPHGGTLFGPSDTALGPDGNLYVASKYTHEILRFNGLTGAYMDRFVTSLSGGLTQPEALTFGPDGNLYVASFGKFDDNFGQVPITRSRILRYNGTTGAFMGVFVPPTLPGSGGLNGATGLTFSPDGQFLLVSSYFTNNVKRYTASGGAFVDTFVAPTPPAVGGPAGPMDLTYGPDGNLYIVSQHGDRVDRYHGTFGLFIDSFVTRGSGGLDKPQSLAFSPDGSTLYVTSEGNHLVKSYDGAAMRQTAVLKYNASTGAFLGSLTQLNNGGLANPEGLSFDSAGNLIVASFGSDKVLRYNRTTGAFLGDFVHDMVGPLWATQGNRFGGMSLGPQNLDLDGDGVGGDVSRLMFVVGQAGGQGKLMAFDELGNAVNVFDPNGDGILEQSAPTTLPTATGIAFSPLDFNLFHPTMRRRGDAGHGINPAFDLHRNNPVDFPRDINGRTSNEGEGGASYYFGLEQFLADPTNGYFTYDGINAQYGIDDSRWHQDLSSNALIRNTYNLPGGAYGSLVTDTFSLEGYSYGDKPTLYFNYFLSTEGANGTAMRDAARVFVSQDGGATWEPLATNNSQLDLELPAFLTTSSIVDTNSPDPKQRVQELFETNNWRQARVDLGDFAGRRDLLLRFDFSTAGQAMEEGLPIPLASFRDFVNPGNYQAAARVQNNQFEGWYIDDFMIGLAERGELVTGTNAGQNQVGFQTPQNPDILATQPVLTGAYQLEIRRGTEHTADAGNTIHRLSPVILADPVETNDRETSGFSLFTPGLYSADQSQAPGMNPGVTIFTFIGTPAPTGTSASQVVGSLTITVVADLDAVDEFLTLVGVGAPTLTQTLFQSADRQLKTVTAKIGLTRAQVLALRGAGSTITFTLTPSAAVDNIVVIDARLEYGSQGVTVADGDSFLLNDGVKQVIFEFDRNGSLSTSAPIPVRPIAVTGLEDAAGLAAAIVNAINAAKVAGLINVSASRTTDDNLNAVANPHFVTSGRVDLFGAASLDMRLSPTLVAAGGEFADGTARPFESRGDRNLFRDQGQIIIESTRIVNSEEFAIVVDASARDGGGNRPHPGGVRNPSELNSQRLVGGVTIQNNLLVAGGSGGILFSGDPNSGNVAPAAVPFGRVLNNTIFGTDSRVGIGIQVTQNASPTLLNNLLSNLAVGVEIDASSSTSVLGGTFFDLNTLHTNTPAAIGSGSFPIFTANTPLTPNVEPVFVNAQIGNFYPAFGSRAIDSSLNVLPDRAAVTTVTAPLGISVSPILAPDFDLIGQLRQDDPDVSSPPGLGENVFKDRGAIDRADFAAPIARLTDPEDNDVAGVDLDPTPNKVVIENGLITVFEVQLVDLNGSGIDDLTVDDTKFQLFKNNVLLVINVDYRFSYDFTNDVARLLPASGVFSNGNVFRIALDNTQATGIKDIAGNALQPNEQTGVTEFVIVLPSDFPPIFAIEPAAIVVPEGTGGTSQAVFNIVVTGVSVAPMTVSFQTQNGSATNPADYGFVSGTLTFQTGELTKTVTVPIVTDSIDEIDETFQLRITSVSANAQIDPLKQTATATILDDDGPNVTINDITVPEGNAGTTPATFTVSLSASSPQTVTVDFTTANGTALQPLDYVLTSGTVTFAPGVTSMPVMVNVRGDLQDEQHETFFVNLSNVQRASIADGQGQATILDDDGPTIRINDVTVTEGNSGTLNATFTVTLSGTSVQTITANVVTADDTALAPGDYTSINTPVTFPSGVTIRTVTVPIVGDMVHEPTERFFVNLVNIQNALPLDLQGVGTIVDTDGPFVNVNDVTIAEGSGGSTLATFDVTLSFATTLPISVDFATAGNTATSGTDFLPASGTLNFAPGQVSKPVTVTVVGDALDELNETFFVNLSNIVSGNAGDLQGLGTITDDDPTPTLTITDVALIESNSGTSAAVYTVALSGPSGLPITVNFGTANGTAIAGSDFNATAGVLTFAPGDTVKFISVPVKGDTIDEQNETYFVNLTGATNVIVADAQGLGTIFDDDGPNVFIGDVTVAEGNEPNTVIATFNVFLSSTSVQTIVVDYTTADIDATAGADYDSATGQLTFAPGTTSLPVSVTVRGDGIDEINERYAVNLTAVQNATITDPQGVGTITDDDGPFVDIGDTTDLEGTGGTTIFTFDVKLVDAAGDPQPSVQPITVSFATANGTASSPSDFAAATGTLVFNPGESVKQVTVQVTGDGFVEVDETFRVNLTAATNAFLRDSRGDALIQDDDVPTLLVSDVTVIEGDSGTKDAVFTVSLSFVGVKPVTVDYSTSPGSANDEFGEIDFEPTMGGLIYEPGERDKFVTVRIVGDRVSEATENYFLLLSSAVGANLGSDVGVGTIVDNDPLPSHTIGLYVPQTGLFQLRNSNSAGPADLVFNFGAGNSGLVALTGDWNGDGIDTPGLYNPADGAILLRDSNTGGGANHTFFFGAGGNAGLVPVAGDFNADGIDTVGLHNPTNGTFFLRNSNASGPADETFFYGAPNAGWQPIFGDWNSDGIETVGMYDRTNGSFFLRNSHSNGPADVLFNFGPKGTAAAAMRPVAGDYNGDFVDTVGLYNSPSNSFFLKNTNAGGIADLQFVFGGGGTPLVGDWNALPGPALRLAGPARGHAASIDGDDIDSTVDAALARWAAAGLDNGQLALLRATHVVVTDLPGNVLGAARGDTIFIDHNAAGRGWYVDATPFADNEFGPHSRKAKGRVDLLTAISHEMGHVLGLDHGSLDRHAASLMSESLPAGVRRTPTEDLLDDVIADEIDWLAR